MENIVVSSKNNEPEELEVVEIVNALYEKYNIPNFTNTVMVEKGSIPHSHPILTLNTRVKDPRLILKTLVHEQLHWHAENHPQYNNCIDYIKTKYIDDGEHNKLGTNPNSYWEHIIVCFNTRNYLESILSKDDIDWVYLQWQAYPTLEKLIAKNKDQIKSDLEKFDLIYT
ncbi:MAG: hypothetical protein KBB86_01760 [Candidatus Pacebacteria bacterium]|nr:hypothetical protein [Candidatus Paceibacterota bacterium]